MLDSTLRKVQVAASMALLVSAPLVCQASQGFTIDDDNRVKVTFGDLNLDSQAGIEALYRRLESAAHRACGNAGVPKRKSLKAHLAAEACFDETLTRLVSEVNNDDLTRIHES